MNSEILRSPWLLLAVVLIVVGLFMFSLFNWPIFGWASIVLGVISLVAAVLRTRT